MRMLTKLLAAVPIAAGLLLAPVAQAQGWHGGRGGPPNRGWHGGPPPGGGWHGGWHGGGGPNGGAIAGAILGLGAAAVIGGVLASQAYAPPPPVVYAAPPPVYYAAPGPTYYQYGY
ncbi:hypothetical protein [Rhodopila sp.]|uniref:hypothetical protein n=1 Tax=Rhodopila sp. TaxID=2480087 RepID=UPI002C8A9EA6|nr:hypothetical protein [Rhodopila sp.]HVZ09828.1 hypothetical protein [Rhodopila sp.]